MKELTLTKSDKVTSNVDMGWYSKDDMLKVLKWPLSLACSYHVRSLHVKLG